MSKLIPTMLLGTALLLAPGSCQGKTNSDNDAKTLCHNAVIANANIIGPAKKFHSEVVTGDTTAKSSKFSITGVVDVSAFDKIKAHKLTYTCAMTGINGRTFEVQQVKLKNG